MQTGGVATARQPVAPAPMPPFLPLTQPPRFNDKACARTVLKEVGLDADAVEKCVGDVDADEAPAVLEDNRRAQARVGWRREKGVGRGWKRCGAGEW